MVMVADLPTGTVAGETEVIAGTGLFTEKLTAAEVPPPGAGLTTVTFATDPFAKSTAVTVAFRLVAEVNVVVSDVPFHCTLEAEMNPDPVTVIEVSEDPAVAAGGVTERADGVGLDCGGGVITVVAPPPQPAITNMQSKIDAMKTHECRAIGFGKAEVTRCLRDGRHDIHSGLYIK